MTNKNVLCGKNFRWLAGVVLAGMLGLTGCVVQPGAGVAYVGPPVVVAGPPAVYEAPAPVVVGPEVVVPLFIGGGGGRYRR
jgi:hypothetical protein